MSDLPYERQRWLCVGDFGGLLGVAHWWRHAGGEHVAGRWLVTLLGFGVWVAVVDDFGTLVQVPE